jgi:polyhydroxybutyrate depolymerase
VSCCGNPNIRPTPDTLADFATRSACGQAPAETRPAPSIRHQVWTGCGPGAAVELYTVEGGGHTWPGSPFDLASRGLGETTKDLVATDVIWRFFRDHPLPPT